MNDPNSPDLDQPLEELDELPAADGPAASAPAPSAPMMAPGLMVAPPAHKQLYQFLWGGIAVLFGCILPFNDYAPGWSGESFWNTDTGIAGVEGSVGFMTFAGAIVAFAAMLFIGAQLFCMKYRKVLLGPIALMAGIAAFSWIRFFKGGAKDVGFAAGFDEEGLAIAPGSPEWMEAYGTFVEEGGKGMASLLYDGQYISDYFMHIGPGYLFTLAGSTYVMLIFIATMLGIGAKKKDPAGAAKPARGGRRR